MKPRGVRFRVRYGREIRRVQRKSVKGFEGRSLSKIGGVLHAAVFMKDDFFRSHLDRSTIGCPPSIFFLTDSNQAERSVTGGQRQIGQGAKAEQNNRSKRY